MTSIKLVIIATFMSLDLSAWTFTKQDLYNYSPSQLEVLKTSYYVGSQVSSDKALDLMAIAVVENQAKLTDSNKNHICGPHQLDVSYANVLCKVVESNPYTSAVLALDNLQSWETGVTKSGKVFKRPPDKVIRMYNVGYTNHNHQWTYLKKFKIARKVIRNNLTWILQH